MELLTDPHMWVALATLTVLELVLGIDNIIFISILVSKLPKAKQETARRIGLFMAMFMRIGLLLLLSVIIGLVEPLFTVMAQPFSGRDLILLAGGLFLIWKARARFTTPWKATRRPLISKPKSASRPSLCKSC